jgi:hypothetical protein
VRLPSVVLELVAGIVLGPAVLGWVEVDLPVQILALIGLAFLLFLSGPEIDARRLRGALLRGAVLGYLLTLALGVPVGLALHAVGWVASPVIVVIALSATSLGLVIVLLIAFTALAEHAGLEPFSAGPVGTPQRAVRPLARTSVPPCAACHPRRAGRLAATGGRGTRNSCYRHVPGDVAAVHRGRRPDRHRAPPHLGGDRRGDGCRGAAVRTALPARSARTAAHRRAFAR